MDLTWADQEWNKKDSAGGAIYEAKVVLILWTDGP